MHRTVQSGEKLLETTVYNIIVPRVKHCRTSLVQIPCASGYFRVIQICVVKTELTVVPYFPNYKATFWTDKFASIFLGWTCIRVVNFVFLFSEISHNLLSNAVLQCSMRSCSTGVNFNSLNLKKAILALKMKRGSTCIQDHLIIRKIRYL